MITLILYGYFGLLLNMAFQLYKHFPRIRKNGGFKGSYYLIDNLVRFVLGLLIIPAVIQFPNAFNDFIKIQPTPEGCFGLGLVVDTIIDSFKNRKK